MAYRAVVRHVRYWRGSIHRWSTVYQFQGTPTAALDATDAETVRFNDDQMCYGPLATDGGTYQCQIYNASSGGVPIASSTSFAWDNPSAWPGYGGDGWVDATGIQEPVAETALLVEWNAGMSRTGKPVKLRKWYHSVPASTSAGGAWDVSGSPLGGLEAQAHALVGMLSAKGLTLGSGTGRFAGAATVSNFYGNHQMPRGRRRKPLVTASGHYTGPTVTVPPIEED